MMPRPEHPDDLTARMVFRDELRQARRCSRWTCAELSDLAGFTYNAVKDLEMRPSWEARRAQQWSRGTGRVFRIRITGLPVPDDDALAVVLKSATVFGGADEDRMHLLAVARDLIRTREAMAVTRAELARRMGVDERALRGWENDPLPSLLKIYQRYGRVLGGALVLDLEPVAVPAVAS